MKKTLIAIAAIAAMGAASAEVTLYGKADVGVSSSNTDGTTSQGAQFGSGNYETSRIGVKGSSEIAGGIKGMFQFEATLDATGGSLGSKLKNTVGVKDAAATTFNREANFGLTGGFGTVQLGKMWTPYDSAFNDALEYNGFSAMGSAFCGGTHCDNGMDGSGASKNGIQYTTPMMSGFNAVVMYGSNGDASSSASATNYTGFGVNYANGPLTVNLATEKVLTSLNNTATNVTAGSNTNAWILAASYNLGVATVFAAAEAATADGFTAGFVSGSAAGSGKDTGSSVGVSVPVSKAMTAALGYATETSSLPSVADSKVSSVGLQVVYAWNAATAIYAGYNKTDSTARDTTVTSASKFATGVRYNF